MKLKSLMFFFERSASDKHTSWREPLIKFLLFFTSNISADFRTQDNEHSYQVPLHWVGQHSGDVHPLLFVPKTINDQWMKSNYVFTFYPFHVWSEPLWPLWGDVPGLSKNIVCNNVSKSRTIVNHDAMSYYNIRISSPNVILRKTCWNLSGKFRRLK